MAGGMAWMGRAQIKCGVCMEVSESTAHTSHSCRQGESQSLGSQIQAGVIALSWLLCGDNNSLTFPFLSLCLQEDVSLSGYQKHVSSCSAPAPLTAAEQELQQIRINEVGIPWHPAPGRFGAQLVQR